jgi:hypothetical protein
MICCKLCRLQISYCSGRETANKVNGERERMIGKRAEADEKKLM